MTKIVFLVRGTLGDVAPVLALAVEWRLLAKTPAASGDGHEEDELLFISDCNNDPSISKTTAEFKIKAATIHNSGPTTTLSSEHLLQLCTGADLIVYNLFALEGFSLAEKLGTKSVAVSPFLVARPPPTRFAEQLQAVYPALHAHLCAAEEVDGGVTWAHVDNWMWRLFLDDVGEFRSRLALPAAPLTNRDGGSKLAKGAIVVPPPLLVGVSACLVAREPYWPKNVVLTGRWSLDATLNSAPSKTARAIVTTLLNGGAAAAPPQDKPPAGAPAAAAAAVKSMKALSTRTTTATASGTAVSKPIIYIGFGSMDSLKGLLSAEQTEHLALAVADAVKEFVASSGLSGSLAFKFLLQTSKGSAYDLALRSSVAALDLAPQQVSILSEHVPHDWLFRQHCRAVVSHGGAGTVHSALAAGVPQVVCPFQFDQFAWAERLSARGLAPPTAPVAARSLTSKQLAAALQWTQSEAASHAAARAAATMAADGSGSLEAVKLLQGALPRKAAGSSTNAV